MDKSTRIKLYRYVSWTLALLSLATFTTGYGLARGWLPNDYLLSWVHRLFEILFIATLSTHIALTSKNSKMRWRATLQGLQRNQATSVHLLRIAQRISSWAIVILALLMIIPGLNGYDFIALYLENIVSFDWHRVFDMFFAFTIILHVAVGIKFAANRRRVKGPSVDFLVVGLTIILLILPLYMEANRIGDPQPPSDVSLILDSNPLDGVIDTYVKIGDIDYGFNSQEVETIRPEIFVSGAFSVFDILVHLDTKELIEMEYHFNTSMQTHTIDSLNGKDNWWFDIAYSGGWAEGNAFRMDLYPWKEGSIVRFIRMPPIFFTKVFPGFLNEVERLEANEGEIILPEVNILGRTVSESFTNVSVTPHNLRTDIFQNGTITAIDVILSLADQGLLTYELTWYDSIGTADIVRSYWVTKINNDEQVGTCGWGYETGEYLMTQLNVIHLPSDTRVILIPEFTLWFWFCV
ncbi:MAG: hypothetical protein ACXADC_07985 [Candidatus Thorarchaeota archaeon]|jgi:hypothetical protein